MDTPIGRLAPSPTGLLHLGHARSFLIAWWSLRGQGGQVLLRMEDLDPTRSTTHYADQTLRDLEWLGLDWDGPVTLQSQGLEGLRAASQSLIDQGETYPCICSRRDIQQALSAPHAGPSRRYPETCRGRFASIEEAEAKTGREAGLRFLVPRSTVQFDDRFAGPQRFDVHGDVGDFLVARRDKTPAYQLAVVVDDARSGVTEVVRGDDLLPSTAQQWLLQEALGLAHPHWFHIPLVVNEKGTRLAKRSDSLALAAFRSAGVDPKELVAWVAKGAGISAAEPAHPREFIRSFSFHALSHQPLKVHADNVDSWKATRHFPPGDHPE